MARKKVPPSPSTEPEKTSAEEQARTLALTEGEFSELVNLRTSIDAFYKTVDDMNIQLRVDEVAALFQPIQKWFSELMDGLEQRDHEEHFQEREQAER